MDSGLTDVFSGVNNKHGEVTKPEIYCTSWIIQLPIGKLNTVTYSGRPFIFGVVIADVHFCFLFCRFSYLYTRACIAVVVIVITIIIIIVVILLRILLYFTPGIYSFIYFFNIYEIRSDTKPDSIMYKKKQHTIRR